MHTAIDPFLIEYFKAMRAEIMLRVSDHKKLVATKIVACGALMGFLLSEDEIGAVYEASGIILVPIVSMLYDVMIAKNIRCIHRVASWIRDEVESRSTFWASLWENAYGQRDLETRNYGRTDIFFLSAFTVATILLSFMYLKQNNFPFSETVLAVLCLMEIFVIRLIWRWILYYETPDRRKPLNVVAGDMNITLTRDQLVPIAESVKKDVDNSLSVTPGARRCLPAWIPQPEHIPDGAVCVAEVGGTNLRVASMVFDAGKANFIDEPEKTAMPWIRGDDFPKDQFLKIIADRIDSLQGGPCSRLGYCFSFPAEPTLDRDARLIHWVKGINVPGMIDQPIGEALLNYLEAHYKTPIDSVSVTNDAVSALFSGLTASAHDAHIGLIVGTGTNAATFIRHKYVTNPAAPKMDREAKIPINLEMGDLPFVHLTKWDEMVDRQSEDPGIHLFEKAVSGMYLGRLFKAMYPKSRFDAESGAKGLIEIIDGKFGYEAEHRTAAINIIIRSADLTAAALAGIIGLLYQQERIRSVCIAAEGALYWSNGTNIQSYNQRVQATLKRLLPDIGTTDVKLTFPEIDHPTITGTAIAALA